MQCNKCGELLEDRFLNLHKERFCSNSEHSFNYLLKNNTWYRRAFYGYMVGVVIVSTWVLSLIILR